MGTTASRNQDQTLAHRRNEPGHSIESVPDYYTLLGLERYSGPRFGETFAAFKTRVDSRFRKLSLNCHPDRAPEGHELQYQRLFVVLNDARDVLGDPVRKRAYDYGLQKQRMDLQLETRVWFSLRNCINLLLLGVAFCDIPYLPHKSLPLISYILEEAISFSAMFGCRSQWEHPDRNNCEYAKEVATGAITGVLLSVGKTFVDDLQLVTHATTVLPRLGMSLLQGSTFALAQIVAQDSLNLAVGAVSLEEMYSKTYAKLLLARMAFGAVSLAAIHIVQEVLESVCHSMLAPMLASDWEPHVLDISSPHSGAVENEIAVPTLAAAVVDAGTNYPVLGCIAALLCGEKLIGFEHKPRSGGSPAAPEDNFALYDAFIFAGIRHQTEVSDRI